MKINYNNRKFVGKSNSSSGEVNSETVFHYFQIDDMLTATYEGGDIRSGQMIGKVDSEGRLNFYYQHINQSGELKAGQCHSIPEIMEDGRLRLYETWKWFDGEEGSSIVEEIE